MFRFHDKKVKIVTTIGPASDNFETTLKLAEAGVDVFRLNLSHRKEEESVKSFKNIRRIESLVKRPLAVMGDLAGPKIRIGVVEGNPQLRIGKKVSITSDNAIGSENRFSLNFSEIISSLVKGAEIYLGDGDIKLEVEKVKNKTALARVVVGGALRSRMSFSAEGLAVSDFNLSAKDRTDIKSMLKLGADAIAVSFVQNENDVKKVKKLLPKNNPPAIIAKIETLSGVQNIEKILDVADGIMVARGDLGLSVPFANVPLLQKDLIALALKKSKPVITATQMLESMTKNHLPTRAEVTDVANAVLDGTDAVMLSGETALGQNPVETVKTMVKIITAATPRISERFYFETSEAGDAVAASVVKTANQVKAKAIVVLTHSGRSAKRIARHRPTQPILALSPEKKTIHELNFLWGVFPHQITMITDLEGSISEARKIAVSNSIYPLKKGDTIVISAGVPFGKGSTTNLLLVQKI